MRGKDAIHRHRPDARGITPAYAGKSCQSLCFLASAEGSPPHMQGKEMPKGLVHRAAGIIPAYAGKSISLLRIACSPIGSPPHMRGKAGAMQPTLVDGRITPAYAGKRLWCRGHGAPGQDYPRVCGEKRSRFKRRQDVKGSPPRMRGKAMVAACLTCLYGITPAYAGKSSERMR